MKVVLSRTNAIDYLHMSAIIAFVAAQAVSQFTPGTVQFPIPFNLWTMTLLVIAGRLLNYADYMLFKKKNGYDTDTIRLD